MRCSSGGDDLAGVVLPVSGVGGEVVVFFGGGVIPTSPLRRAPRGRSAGGRKALVADPAAPRPAGALVCAQDRCVQQIEPEEFGGYVRRENRKEQLIENRLAPINLRLGMPFGC